MWSKNRSKFDQFVSIMLRLPSFAAIFNIAAWSTLGKMFFALNTKEQHSLSSQSLKCDYDNLGPLPTSELIIASRGMLLLICLNLNL